MLNIIKEIQKTSVDQVVNKYNLKYKDYGHKFLLKYSQIDSYDFKAADAVREARGLVLSKDLKVMSYAFKRFFNLQEKEADDINFETAYVLKKEDGSCMTLYWDWYLNMWCVQTTGTADAKVPVGENNMTFADLFWDIFYESHNATLESFDKRKNYVFEVCSKYNKVVKEHDTAKLVLLNVRNLEDLSELSYTDLIDIGQKIGINAVESYNLNSVDGIMEMISDMEAEDEGFVACEYDGHTNIRVKIKNPDYVLKHKTETNFSQKDVFTILKENERDEFVGVVERYKDLFNKAEHYWFKLISEGYKLISRVYTLKDQMNSKKEFASAIIPLKTDYNSLFYGEMFKSIELYLETGVFKLFDPTDILRDIPNRKLNSMFKRFLKKEYNIE